jgi:Kdo2-lipid IVA lauroyltransferase/acyltransferase
VLGKIVVSFLMQRLPSRARPRFSGLTELLGQAAVGALTIGILRTARHFDPIKTANLFGRIARSIGSRMREQKIGRANLSTAFPEKSPAEIEDTSCRAAVNPGHASSRNRG